MEPRQRAGLCSATEESPSPRAEPLPGKAGNGGGGKAPAAQRRDSSVGARLSARGERRAAPCCYGYPAETPVLLRKRPPWSRGSALDCAARPRNLPPLARSPCRAKPGTAAGGKLLPPSVEILRSAPGFSPRGERRAAPFLQNDCLAGFGTRQMTKTGRERVLPAGSSRPSGGYRAQVWPPATMTGPELLSVVLSPTWPNSLYPQQRATPSWFTPQVW